jgi:hypothetical protein
MPQRVGGDIFEAGGRRLTQQFIFQMPIKRNRLGISESKHLSHLGVKSNCLQYASVVVKRFSMVSFDELERAGEEPKQERMKIVSCATDQGTYISYLSKAILGKRT